jgi:hypothetical protein
MAAYLEGITPTNVFPIETLEEIEPEGLTYQRINNKARAAF